MIIWLASYPRSGNSMYRELLWQLCGIPTWSVYNDPEVQELGMTDAVGHRQMYYQDAMEFVRDDEPHFIKTHELANRPHDDFAAIYIVRDGRDAIVSRTHFTFNFGGDKFGYKDFNGVMAELCRPHEGKPTWNEHVLYWLRKRKRPVTLVKFEDMLKDPSGVLMWSLDQMGVEIKPPDKRAMTFEELHKRWPKFFTSGKVGRWKDEMPREIQDIFWQHNWEAMQELGYVR